MLISRDDNYQIGARGTKVYSCYCVTYKDKAVMIDAGPLSERDAIEKNLGKDFIFDIDAILLTHSHCDSASNSEYFSMLFNCPVYCMKDAVEAVRTGRCKRPPKDHPYIKKAGAAGSIVPKRCRRTARKGRGPSFHPRTLRRPHLPEARRHGPDR